MAKKRRTPAQLFTRRTYNIFRHQKDRAKEAGVSLDYKLDDLRRLIREALGDYCPHCQTVLTIQNLNVDHRLPLQRGGRHTRENLGVICERCNQIKGNMDVSEYDWLLEALAVMHVEARRNVLARIRAGGMITCKKRAA